MDKDLDKKESKQSVLRFLRKRVLGMEEFINRIDPQKQYLTVKDKTNNKPCENRENHDTNRDVTEQLLKKPPNLSEEVKEYYDENGNEMTKKEFLKNTSSEDEYEYEYVEVEVEVEEYDSDDGREHK